MRGLLYFERTGNADELAGLQGFQLRQFFAVGFQQVGQLEQHCGAGGGAGVRPGGKALARGADGMVDIGLVGVGDVGDGLAVGRVDHGNVRRRLAGEVLAVDEHAMLAGQEGRDGR
ncbi:hypothetical protein D3C80_1584290 [compost metagenome]